MADFDAQIKASQEQVAAAQTKISNITSRIEAARGTLDQADAINVENATLADVKSHTDLMNANIAELIMGLDDVTAGFSRVPNLNQCGRNRCAMPRLTTSCRT